MFVEGAHPCPDIAIRMFVAASIKTSGYAWPPFSAVKSQNPMSRCRVPAPPERPATANFFDHVCPGVGHQANGTNVTTQAMFVMDVPSPGHSLRNEPRRTRAMEEHRRVQYDLLLTPP